MANNKLSNHLEKIDCDREIKSQFRVSRCVLYFDIISLILVILLKLIRKPGLSFSQFYRFLLLQNMYIFNLTLFIF